MTNIQKVAQHANVSVATVSRVINQSSSVKPGTRKRVEDAIRELEYVPNMLARNFRTSQSKSILVILTNISNLFYMEMVHGISEYANSQGYDILLSETNGDSQKQIECMNKVKNRVTDGAIIIETTVNNKALMMLERSNPVVQCCSHSNKVALPYVGVDNIKGGYLAGKTLLAAGCRKPVFAGIKGNSPYNTDRKEGFFKAFLEAGIEEDQIYTVYSDLSLKGGVKAAEEIAEKTTADGVFFVSDMLALSALKVFQKKGIRVPEDLSVIGYDNLELDEMIIPSLSTVAQPAKEMGRESARILIERLNAIDTNNNRDVIFEPEVILRESVKRPSE